eukprot:TRINITY_DN746_c0_g1_i1.p1 TRINITY_DN746_c0_g1~~TRINITY_DN746_c0_g1_i1.p1  ORF type:complete len:183 (+),score=36.46 TRINITY_DN746_c0_g1_i1:225-773(+)
MASNKPHDKALCKRLLEEGYSLGQKAIELAPSHFGGYKWSAICLSGLGDHVSQKEKIQNAFKIKEFATKAAELRPGDATTFHVLGRWCYGVTNISWIERKLAAALFATPPTSSYEEALSYFQKAHEIEPKLPRNLLLLGDCHVALKQSAEAKTFYQQLLALPIASEVDRLLHEEATTKLRKL